jgi:hypothetical protein
VSEYDLTKNMVVDQERDRPATKIQDITERLAEIERPVDKGHLIGDRGEWRSVKDDPPPENEVVLVQWPGAPKGCALGIHRTKRTSCSKLGWQICFFNFVFYAPTFNPPVRWMPLPPVV